MHRRPAHATLEPRPDGRALPSLVLGLLSLTLGFPAALPALALGLAARRAIERARGGVGGYGVATAGVLTGALGSAVGMVQLAAAVALVVAAARPPARLAETAPFPAEAPVVAPVEPKIAAPAPLVRGYGALEVVELDARRPYRVQLGQIAERARRQSKLVVVQTSAKRCAACAELDRALPHAAMQAALRDVILVRADVETFSDDLEADRIETAASPWFFKIDAQLRPSDAMSADEWDENSPEAMAQVLGAFCRGRLRERRVPPPTSIAL